VPLLGVLAVEGRQAGLRPYLVGGGVRDLLLGREPLDLDVALEGPLGGFASLIQALESRGWACTARHPRFGTARLRGPAGEAFDLAATREESYPSPGALPVVTPGVSIGRDLARRDFTIHAMALPIGEAGIESALLDPFGGVSDLGHTRIRLLHEGSLADDPTRVFRAARYAARLAFDLDAGFEAAVRMGIESGAFARISGDRLRRALHELLSEENRTVALRVLAQLSVPAAVVDGWEIGTPVPDAVGGAGGADDAWARLLGSAEPDLRERIATRLSFSRALRRTTGCRR
jgi:tRNA nucleotidyltransferase (CCA-adding enzyme)